MLSALFAYLSIHVVLATSSCDRYSNTLINAQSDGRQVHNLLSPDLGNAIGKEHISSFGHVINDLCQATTRPKRQVEELGQHRTKVFITIAKHLSLKNIYILIDENDLIKEFKNCTHLLKSLFRDADTDFTTRLIAVNSDHIHNLKMNITTTNIGIISLSNTTRMQHIIVQVKIHYQWFTSHTSMIYF